MQTSPSLLPASLVEDVSLASPRGQRVQSTPTKDCRHLSGDLDITLKHGRDGIPGTFEEHRLRTHERMLISSGATKRQSHSRWAVCTL